MRPRLEEVLGASKVVICVGGGGVGKTTVSAALALSAARAGRHALVVTVDPARRLAGALGLQTLCDEPQPLPPEALQLLDPLAGSFHAMMLDRERAWARVIARHAPTEAAKERILGNRLYHELSRRFAGTHEYLAVEELCALAEVGTFDLIALDTPPAPHAFEFLDAPERLRRLIDRRVPRWILEARVGLEESPITRAMSSVARRIRDELERAAGATALAEFADLLGGMSALFAAFSERARAMTALLRAPTTALVLVTGPDARAERDAEECLAALELRRLSPKAIVANRWHRPLAEGTPSDALAAAGVAPELARWIARNHADHVRLARGHAQRLARLEERAPPGAAIVPVPNLDSDVHDVGGVDRIAACLAA